MQHHTYLQRFDDAFQEAADESRKLVSGLNDSQFNWRPGPERWSIGECIGHLNVAGYLLLPILEEAIADARDKQMTADGAPKYTFIERAFIRANSAEPRKRRRSPKLYRPPVNHSLDESIPRFVKLQNDLRRVAAASESLDLARIRVPSPISRFLKLGVGAWFEVTDAHQRRHLRQARLVREDERFPE